MSRETWLQLTDIVFMRHMVDGFKHFQKAVKQPTPQNKTKKGAKIKVKQRIAKGRSSGKALTRTALV